MYMPAPVLHTHYVCSSSDITLIAVLPVCVFLLMLIQTVYVVTWYLALPLFQELCHSRLSAVTGIWGDTGQLPERTGHCKCVCDVYGACHREGRGRRQRWGEGECKWSIVSSDML